MTSERISRSEEVERLIFDREYIARTLEANYDPRYKQSIVKHPFPYVSGYKNEWWCELQHRPKLSEYFDRGAKLYQESGKRGSKRNLYCYVKFPHMRDLQCIGFMVMDDRMFSKVPTRDCRITHLLPEDFQLYFLPLPDFRGIVDEFDDLDRAAPDLAANSLNLYTDEEEFRAEIRAFTYERKIRETTEDFYRYWKPFILVDNGTELPTPLMLATLYANVDPPYECLYLHDWRGFQVEQPSRKLPIVSEILGSGESRGRQFVVTSPRSIAEQIVSKFKEGQPASFSEVFREEYEVTCLPFDLDVTGPIADLCYNDRSQEGEYLDGCVRELCSRLNLQLRLFLQDDFDIRSWTMHSFRRRVRSRNKLSFHLYQILPRNVSFKSIDHVRTLVNRMIEEMKDRSLLFSHAGTLLGHWECEVGGENYATLAEEHHSFFHGPDGKRLNRSPRLNSRFVSYIDSQIYQVNRSLRLPGCSKSKNMEDVMVRVSDDDVDEIDVVSSLAHFSHRCNENVIGVLRSYPKSEQSFRQRQVRIKYSVGERKMHERVSETLAVSDDDVRQLRDFIEKKYETTVTKCKRLDCALCFDTTLSYCPFAKRVHQNAKQYFVFRGRESSTLLNKCWHSHCQGQYMITTVPCLAKS